MIFISQFMAIFDHFLHKTLSKYDLKFNLHIWKEINYAGNMFLWQKTSTILKKCHLKQKNINIFRRYLNLLPFLLDRGSIYIYI